ncbi:MAG: hypothetical protein O2814_00060 [Bacteroidetes bacterium]|nr:hypothetical protein [Bacteroidota bacterium]MDA1224803.1 hypothetical protein [Bacteroidota bacterium]
MILDQYYRAFSGLLNEIKGVSHCLSDIQRGYLPSDEFVRRAGLLLAKLSDEDLKAVTDRLKATKYFNAVIQAQVAVSGQQRLCRQAAPKAQSNAKRQSHSLPRRGQPSAES